MRSMIHRNNLNISVRLATREDAKRLNEIEEACIPKKLRYGPSILASLLSMTSNYITLAVELAEGKKAKIIGFAMGEQDDDKKSLGRIVTIQIDPFYQHRQLGSRLLAELETRLQNSYNINTIELQVHYQNEEAINFYQKHAYKIKKQLRNYYVRGEHAFLMEKKLKKLNFSLKRSFQP
ncbi:MAG: GNAT family N-acetyltransferase [Candidatus Heimdallarchaeota archaeon]|nr:MAG: GNAT family N-acetyltransferase [Candidatus Heimdallarchaeota archaeon]